MERSARASSTSKGGGVLSSAAREGEEQATRPPLLEEAADAVLEASKQAPFPPRAEELRDDLQDLVAAISAILEGGDPDTAREALRRRARRPGLRTALRGEILRRSACRDSDSEAAHVLELVRAIEDLGPTRWSDVSEEESLLPLVMEPDAFELLVEVAHDIRSPLTSILFLSETLRGGRSGRVNDVQRSQLGLIYGASLGLHSVASDVIDLARGGRELEEEPQAFTISEIFQSVIDLVQPVAEEKGLDIRLDIPGFDHCVGQPLLLGRVLLNLTTNGLKFTSEGFVELSARRERRRAVTFSVRDTGRGLDEGSRSNLYEPFKKSSDRRGHFFSGAGLGLSIARRLVRRMGAEIEHESDPESGTRFFFTLDLPPARGR